jgi:putative transposase
MTLSEKIKLTDNKDDSVSLTKQCNWLGINRSTLYYTPIAESEYNLRLMRAMDELHCEDPTLGSRRICISLQNMGFQVCRDKVRRLMKLMRLVPIYCKPRTTVADPTKYKYPYLLRGMKIDKPNQVWMIDISYVPLEKGFMYFFGIIDVHSRKLLGWSLSNTMDAKWVCETIKETISRFGTPQVINSDQGSQFTSEEYIGLIKSYENIKISMDGKGRAIDNVYIERFFRTLKYEKLYICPANDGLTLWKNCEMFIEYYNSQRIHSSLNYKTPDLLYYMAA